MNSNLLEKQNFAKANQINNYHITDFCNNIDECDEHLAEKLEKYNEETTRLLPWAERIKRFCGYINLRLWSCVVLISFICCLVGIMTDVTAGLCFSQRVKFIETLDRIDVQYVVWIISSIILALMSTGVCWYFSMEACGSGIPEIKTILSGINFYKYFHLKTFFTKIFGLITAQAAGFFIGFEGPIIHLSTMVAENLLQLPVYRTLRKNNMTRKTMINTAIAAGVVSTFGTPFGAVVFSIELCTAVYL